MKVRIIQGFLSAISILLAVLTGVILGGGAAVALITLLWGFLRAG